MAKISNFSHRGNTANGENIAQAELDFSPLAAFLNTISTDHNIEYNGAAIAELLQEAILNFSIVAKHVRDPAILDFYSSGMVTLAELTIVFNKIKPIHEK